MPNQCDTHCGHTHNTYDIPRCQNNVTHHAVTHILNMTYLDVKQCDSPCGRTHIKYDIP